MKLIQLRTKKGITQGELAQACQTTQQQIAKIENGIVDPKLSTLRRLAEALNCEISELFWTKKEFLKELNQAMETHNIKTKNLSFAVLNSICLAEQKISSYHPFWEQLEIKKHKLQFKENQNE